MKRSDFLKMGSLGLIGLSLAPSMCLADVLKPDILFFEISLAQWSLHRTIKSGKLNPIDFPVKARKSFDLGSHNHSVHRPQWTYYTLSYAPPW